STAAFTSPVDLSAEAGGETAAEVEPMTATTLLTGTVSPSLTRISDTTPAAGDGISASTLSVEISNSGSSRSTFSPTFLIQRTIVPSAIDSPICGITTSVAIVSLALRTADCGRRTAIRNHSAIRIPRSALQVYARPMRRVGGLSNRFGERRVRVDRANQLLDRRFEPQRHRGLGHQLGRARADHVDAKQLVVFLLRDDLHES